MSNSIVSRWYLLDNTHENILTCLSASQAKHDATVPNNTFSKVVSDSAAKCLIKVPCADDAWEVANGLDAVFDVCLARYTTVSDSARLAEIAGADWTNTRIPE